MDLTWRNHDADGFREGQRVWQQFAIMNETELGRRRFRSDVRLLKHASKRRVFEPARR